MFHLQRIIHLYEKILTHKWSSEIDVNAFHWL